MHLFLSEVFQVDFSDQWIVFSTGILALWCILREGCVIEFCFWLPPCLLCFGNEFVVFYLLFIFSLVFRFSCPYDSSSSSSSFSFFLIYFSGETRKFVLITKNMSKMTSYPIVPERKEKQYTMYVSTQNMEKQVLQKIKLTPKFSFLILQKTFLNKRPLS